MNITSIINTLTVKDIPDALRAFANIVEKDIAIQGCRANSKPIIRPNAIKFIDSLTVQVDFFNKRGYFKCWKLRDFKKGDVVSIEMLGVEKHGYTVRFDNGSEAYIPKKFVVRFHNI